MTDTELRDLDAEIHRLVTGRESRPLKGLDGHPMLEMPRRDVETHVPVPRYSSDIAAAWLVVEALRGREAMLDLTGPFDVQSGEEWRADIRLAEYGYVVQSGSATERTAPLAICKAALAALRNGEG